MTVFNVNATGGLHLRKEGKAMWASIRHLFEPTDHRGYRRNRRGWGVYLAHGVKDPTKKQLGEIFEYLKARSADVWVGLFREVALYGQQRDTATLTVNIASEKEIRLTLTDEMDNKIFNFPLTVKVRLYPSWKAAKATQNGKAVKAAVVSHEGKTYALVQVVPDGGIVVLSPAGPTTN